MRFGRELNASDDRAAFTGVSGDARSRPVLEGKLLSPFRVDTGRAAHELPASAAVHTRVPRRPRLAYRDVASATNRLTLIAAIVPARAVTTHTLFCLRAPIALERQLVLCGLMNSLVANYLVRRRVSTHVTVAIVSRLPMPFVGPDDPAAPRLVALVRTLMSGDKPVEEMPEYAQLQALTASLYGLASDDFRHILGTFPLIPAGVREAALVAFEARAWV